ncbi:MAG: histidine phosphatase family protein [Actinobacteria bacterium]|nr:histidine phosphatase family protein [Actinomycetota bacterium]
MTDPRVFRQPRFQAPPRACEILLVRHGESQAHVEGESFRMVDGHGDPPLSEDGREQAERVGERLANERIDAIYVTNLRRTAETAAPLADRLGLEPIVEPDMREVFLGEWEGGLFRQKVAERDPIAVRMFQEQRWDVIPGAESSEALAVRVRRAIERIAVAHPDQRVALFAHGGTIGTALCEATHADSWSFVGSDNGAISHLVITPDRWILRRFNDTAHLDDGMTVRSEPLT